MTRKLLRRLREQSTSHGAIEVGIAVTLTMGLTAGLLGSGPLRSTLRLGDGAIWLAKEVEGRVAGFFVGDSGDVRAKTPTLGGQDVKLIEVAGGVIAFDPETGQMTEIDLSAWELGDKSEPLENEYRDDYRQGGGKLWFIDFAAGAVVEVDPTTLSVLSESSVGAAAISAVADASGRLWVLRDDGAVWSVESGTGNASSQFLAGSAADLKLIRVGESAYLLDPSGGKMVPLQKGGVGEAILVPALQESTGELKVALESEGDNAWFLLGSKLIRVNVDSELLDEFSVPGLSSDVGAPVASGHKLAIPDYGHGNVVVLDAATGEADDPVDVKGYDRFTDEPFELKGKDETFWINPRASSKVTIVRHDGKGRVIDTEGKETPEVRPRKDPPPPPFPPPPPTDPGGEPGLAPPDSELSPPPDEASDETSNEPPTRPEITATPGPGQGKLTVRWSASKGTPTPSYVIYLDGQERAREGSAERRTTISGLSPASYTVVVMATNGVAGSKSRPYPVTISEAPLLSKVTLTDPDGQNQDFDANWVVDFKGQTGKITLTDGVSGEPVPVDTDGPGSKRLTLAWGPNRVTAVACVKEKCSGTVTSNTVTSGQKPTLSGCDLHETDTDTPDPNGNQPMLGSMFHFHWYQDLHGAPQPTSYWWQVINNAKNPESSAVRPDGARWRAWLSSSGDGWAGNGESLTFTVTVTVPGFKETISCSETV